MYGQEAAKWGSAKINITDITNFEKYLLDKIRTSGKKILERIEKEQSLDKDLETELNNFLEKTTQSFLEENNAQS